MIFLLMCREIVLPLMENFFFFAGGTNYYDALAMRKLDHPQLKAQRKPLKSIMKVNHLTNYTSPFDYAVSTN